MEEFFSKLSKWSYGNPIDQLMEKYPAKQQDTISLSVGTPGKDSMPMKTLQKSMESLFYKSGVDFLGYGDTKGDEELQKWIIEYHRRENVFVELEHVMITSGSTQGFDLCCKLLLNEGDIVITENPTYGNSISTMKSYGIDLHTVSIDEHGMDTDELEEKLRFLYQTGQKGQKVKFVYVIPHAQNPSGATLSIERRMKLLKLAKTYGFLIIEDDPYSGVMFEQPLPSIFSLDQQRTHVIYLNSFSKIIAPGLRIGWILTHPSLIQQMVLQKQSMDSCSSSFSQKVILELFQQESFDTYFYRLKENYQLKKDTMTRAIHTHLSPYVSSWKEPKGGFFVWLTLPNIDTQELLNHALQKGVSFLPGTVFQANREKQETLRLCYSFYEPKEIEKGIVRLKQSIETYKK